MSAPYALPGEINYGLVDRFTIGHLATGVLMRLFGQGRIPWWAALGLAVGWEIIERPLKDAFPSLFPYSSQDTLQNAAGDVAAVMLGYGLVALIDGRDVAWVQL